MKTGIVRLPMLVVAVASAATAHAHHPMGGRTPESLWQGFASGLAHPLIEVDHLVFVLASVVLAMWLDGGRARGPLMFVGASLLGVFAHVHGVGLPLGALWVAISLLLVAVAGWCLRNRGGIAPGLAVFCAVCGLVHGHAYGEAIVGAEPTPVSAYLVGLTLVQAALVMGLLGLWRRFRYTRPAWWRRAQQLTMALSAALGLYGISLVLGS